MRRNNKVLLFFFMTILNFISSATTGTGSHKLKLISVAVITRHGDRTPIDPLPDENEQFWKASLEKKPVSGFAKEMFQRYESELSDLKHKLWGQLTAKGCYQLRDLGSSFRKKYVNELKFLPENVDLDSIKLWSSGKQRTLESGQHFFLGLYPTKFRDESIPIVYPTTFIQIPSKNKEKGSIWKDSNLEKKYQTQLNYLHYFYSSVYPFGPKFDNYHSVIDISSTLFCRQHHIPYSLPIPFPFPVVNQFHILANEIQSSVVNSMSKVTKKSIYSQFFSTIVNTLTEAKNNKIIKFSLFSAHDTTLLEVLDILGINIRKFGNPIYASNIEFQLFENTSSGEYFIKAFFSGKELPIFTCGSANSFECPFEKFSNLF